MRLILQALVRHCLNHGNSVAIIDCDGRTNTWLEIQDRAARIQTAVEKITDPGVCVAVHIPSGSDFWCAFLGIASAGRIPVLVPFPMPRTVVERIESDIGKIFVFDQASVRMAQSELASSNHAHDPIGAVLLSSGTTGFPRFVFRCADAIDRVAKTLVQEGLAVAGGRSPSFIPMAHAYGFEHAVLAPILAGSCVRAFDAFSIPTAVEQLASGATALCLVPTTAEILAQHLPDAPSLVSIVVAGTHFKPATRQIIERAFAVTVVDLYGASETGTIWLDRGQGGRPVAGVTVRIVQQTKSQKLIDVPVGVQGEIAVHSNAMGEAILRNHGERIPLQEHGFFRTGDLGHMDANGTFHITGRKKLIFDVGGLKVNPLEVEGMVESHSAIRRALIHPIQVSESLNRVGLKIVLHDGYKAPTIEDLRLFLAPMIAPHAIPRTLVIVDDLPTTASGKLIRKDNALRIEPVIVRPIGLGNQDVREAFTKVLFNATAIRYDISSGAAFLGSGRWYRRRMLLKSGLRPGSSLLDVGSGTGLCAAIAQKVVGPSGRVVALDPSDGMLAIAKRRGVCETVLGSAEHLPFGNNSFDLISMSYMLRHVDDLRVAFHEAKRVLRPGGKIIILEVTRPVTPIARRVFHFAMKWYVPGLGVIASGRPSTFAMMRYWADTIEQAAPPCEIVQALDSCGFLGARHQRELGIFSSYRGVAPPA